MSAFSTFSRAMIAVGISAGCAIVAQGQETRQPPSRLPTATVVGTQGASVAIQNDRDATVTFFVDAGRVDRSIGTVQAGAMTSLELPAWAVKGKRTVRVNARIDGGTKAIATYDVPLNAGRVVGLLVPPAGGLPQSDSVLVSVPAGSSKAATVAVSNQRDASVTVYAEKGLLFVRLGEVSAKQQQTLVLPDLLSRTKGSVRVFARPAGGPDVATPSMHLEKGDRIAVIVM